MRKCIAIILILTANLINAQIEGKASFYDNRLHGGKRTASGEIFWEHKFTAASNSHKLGTKVRVTNKDNGKSTVVKINDTGGFAKYNRIIDLSKAAFASIADIRKGIINVIVEVIE